MTPEELVLKAYGDCEGPFGFRMPSELAKVAEKALEGMSSEIKMELACEINGETIPGLCRLAILPEESDHLEDKNERTDKALVMTESVDRDREVVMANGCSWKDFQKNPQVTWCHNYCQLPVGRAIYVTRNKSSNPKKNGWVAKTRYHARPKDFVGEWFADGVWGLISEGALPGKSIGFLPIKARAVGEKDLIARPDMAKCGWVIEKCLILEYAVGVLPVNADTLQISVGKLRQKGILGLDRVLEAMDFVMPAQGKTLEDETIDTPVGVLPFTVGGDQVIDHKSTETIFQEELANVEIGDMIRDEFDCMCGRIG